MTYDDELSSYDDAFNNAPDDTGPPEEVPPGKYQAVVDKAEITYPKWSAFPRLSLQCRVISGPQKGRMLFPDASFDPEVKVPFGDTKVAPIFFVKQMCVRMELDPPVKSAGEVGDRLRDMLDRILEIKVAKQKKNPEYRDYYVQRFVAMAAPGDEPPPHGDGDYPPDADIPF
jgi:hypothetical protein